MKKYIFLFLIFAMLTIAVSAQSMPGFEQSAQGLATQGIFTSDADHFIMPDSYADVEFEKFYGMVSFSRPNRAQIGAATKFGSVYTAIAYSGSFWANLTSTSASGITATAGDAFGWTGPDKTFADYSVPDFSNIPAYFAALPDNNVAVLIGVGDMGFRFALSSTYKSFDEEDVFSGDIAAAGPPGMSPYFKSVSMQAGAITPQIAWSWNKSLTAKGISPWITFDLGFYSENARAEAYVNSTAETTGEMIGFSEDYMEPKINIGLGGYDLYENESGFSLSADFDYLLTIRSYSNDYNYMDGGKFKSKSVSGVYNPNSGGIVEQSEMEHVITPYLSGEWKSEKLSLGFLISLPLSFTSETYTEMTAETGTGKLLKEGNSGSVFTIGFAPSIQLGLQWQIVPKLTLNAGALLEFSAITSETDSYDRYSNNEKVANSSGETVTTSFGGSFTNQLTLGVTLDPTENFSIQAACGMGNAEMTGNRINVFSTGGDGLFAFGKVMIGLRF
jgi:hypothetical protein